MIRPPCKLLPSLCCLICVLAFVVPCKGIGITLISEAGYTRSYANSGESFIQDPDFVTALPQIGSTAATTTKASVRSLYAFTNSASAANFFVSWTAALLNGQEATTDTSLTFVGAHDLHYELNGSYAGLLAPAEDVPFSAGDVARFQTGLVYGDAFPFFEDAIFGGVNGSLFHYSFSSSGTLPAGNVIGLSQFASLRGILEEGGLSGPAVGTGFWNLKLTENHVPDAGSTVTLLGIVLGGLGFIAARRISLEAQS